jgi:hypothetical protein
VLQVGGDSIVCIATCYGLDGPGIESRWGRDFPHLSLGPNQLPIQWVLGLFPVVKRPGRGVDRPPPSGAEVKESVEVYLYYPLWAIVACSRVNFTYFACYTSSNERLAYTENKDKGNK